MTDVGLDRSDPAGELRRAVFAEDRAQRVGFDGIAHRSARAVGFDILNLFGMYARSPARCSQEFFLGLLTGDR